MKSWNLKLHSIWHIKSVGIWRFSSSVSSVGSNGPILVASVRKGMGESNLPSLSHHFCPGKTRVSMIPTHQNQGWGKKTAKEDAETPGSERGNIGGRRRRGRRHIKGRGGNKRQGKLDALTVRKKIWAHTPRRVWLNSTRKCYGLGNRRSWWYQERKLGGEEMLDLPGNHHIKES